LIEKEKPEDGQPKSTETHFSFIIFHFSFFILHRQAESFPKWKMGNEKWQIIN
jgi:hypothetical protein